MKKILRRMSYISIVSLVGILAFFTRTEHKKYDTVSGVDFSVEKASADIPTPPPSDSDGGDDGDGDG
jgi:hypothetical protein